MNSEEKKQIEKMEEAAQRLWIIKFGGILILLESATILLLVLWYLLRQAGVYIEWAF